METDMNMEMSMNIIICGKSCRYQNQGYCGLKHITQLTGSASGESCGYYEPMTGKPDAERHNPNMR